MINRFLLGLGALLLCILVVTHVSAAETDILCPDVEAAKKETPSDVAGVQADIDRLNLCVERARLLKQLDDIAKQRTDTLNKVSGGGDMSGSGLGIIPTLPVSALPSLPDAKPKAGGVTIKQSAANPLDAGGGAAAAEPETTSWKIRKIWGQAGGVSGATMRAQLSNGKGGLLNVVKGDPLPDGQVVESVSIKGVTLSRSSSKGSGKINDLSWEEENDSASSDAGSGSSGSSAGKTIAVPMTP